jgi:hypothetical protein
MLTFDVKTLRDNLFRVALVSMIVAAVCAPLFFHANDPSKVGSASILIGTVDGIQQIGSGRLNGSAGYAYRLRLDDSDVIVVWDRASRPHLIGSRAEIERIDMEDGRVAYRFVN